jgi:hypothetical protein
MNTIVSSLSELIKTLIDSFRFSGIFPSLFFLLLNRLFVFRYFEHLSPFREVSSQGVWDQALIISLLALLIGYTVNAIEVPIVRLYEGYPWQDSRLGRCFTEWQRGHLDWLEREIKQLSRELTRHYHSSLESVEVDELDTKIKRYKAQVVSGFPPNPARMLPTGLGNVIAAFEAYPGKRYGMDGVTSWPRLLPILAEAGFLPYVTQARSTVDFLLNTSFLMVAFGFECISLRILFVSDVSWVLPVGAFTVAGVFYMAAITSAYNWAAVFQAAFDLFRYHLARALGLKVMSSIEQEQIQWSNLTKFWQRAEEFDGFAHSKEDWPVPARKKEEDEQ